MDVVDTSQDTSSKLASERIPYSVYQPLAMFIESLLMIHTFSGCGRGIVAVGLGRVCDADALFTVDGLARGQVLYNQVSTVC